MPTDAFGLPPEEPKPPPRTQAGRVLAIDALRGFDMFWIVGGGAMLSALAGLIWSPVPGWLKYQLEHPEWEGFSAWDMIMPLFLFIVGAAMPFSFAARIARGASRKALYGKILVRAVILFVLGMAAQGNLLAYDLSKLHLFSNTLQAIACGYVVAGLLLLNVGAVLQVVACVGLLAGYWALMMHVPWGGHAAGTLEPTANFALHIDTLILGRFRDGTTYTWILSSMGFAATVLLGVFAGKVLQASKQPLTKVILLALLAGLCLAGGWAWGMHPSPVRFPIIKHVWSSSMVLWSGGWCFALLALFYLLIDVCGWRRWAFFFVVLGANAIAVYMGQQLGVFQRIAGIFVEGFVERIGAWGPLVNHAAAFAILWFVLLYLYRKKTFIRV